MKRIIISITCLYIAFMLAGCGRMETYGKEIKSRSITEVKDIITNPNDYDGKTVTVEGKIITECPTGCWLDLKDDNAVIYVEIGASGFAIPQKVGRNITIEGKVKKDKMKTIIVGEGVEIK